MAVARPLLPTVGGEVVSEKVGTPPGPLALRLLSAPAVLPAPTPAPALVAAAAMVPPRVPEAAIRDVVVPALTAVARVGPNGPPIPPTGPLNESRLAASALPTVLPRAPRALETRLTQPMRPRVAPTPVRVTSSLPREVRAALRTTPPVAGVARTRAEPRSRARTAAKVGAGAVLSAPHAVRPVAGRHAPVAPV